MVNWSLFKRAFVFYANKAPCSLFLHATQCFTNWEILLPHVSHSGPSFTENNGTASSRRRSSTASSTTPWWRPSRPGRLTSPSPVFPSTSTVSSALMWPMRSRTRAKFWRNNTRWVGGVWDLIKSELGWDDWMETKFARLFFIRANQVLAKKSFFLNPDK